MKKILFLTAFLMLISNNSYAYLDPGTGSLIIQSLLALIAMIGAYLSIYWRKFKSLFKKNKDNKKNKN
jgi:hypothetical protein